MRYDWKCKACGEAVEVQRSVAEYERGPEGEEAKHDGCTFTKFSRCLSVPLRVVVHENEDVYA